MSIEKTAFAFAAAAHYAVGQKRKYSGDDYIVHPIRVAQTVKQFGGNDDMVDYLLARCCRRYTS